MALKTEVSSQHSYNKISVTEVKFRERCSQMCLRSFSVSTPSKKISEEHSQTSCAYTYYKLKKISVITNILPVTMQRVLS